MKILIVGNDEPWAIERSYASALRVLGSTVDMFDWWRAGVPGGRRALGRRPLWPLMARRANRALIARAAVDYDAVFVFKGLLIDEGTVRALRQPDRVVVCFNPDNPWNRAVTSYSPVAEAAMPAWDAYLIWSPFLVSRLYSAGCKRVEVLPFAWDPSAHPHLEVDCSGESAEIVFAANWSAHRERWIARLSDLPITLYGRPWAQPVKRLGRVRLKVEPQVPLREEYSAILARAKVSLNIIDPHNCPGINMRSFEIPGAGGVTCSTWTEDVETFFPNGAVATFRTEEELRAVIHWLRNDPTARAELRSRSHAIAARHTFDSRARQVLRLFADLRGHGA